MTLDTATAEKEDIHAEVRPDPKDLATILAKHNGARGGLIAILEEIQDEYGYLPEEALRTVSDQTGRPLVDVYGIATFYRSFSLKPRGKHLVCACLGTACHVRGAARVVGEFERQLGIKPGETTLDKEFTLETVNCLGACALGPVVVIGGHYFPKVGRARVRALLDDTLAGFQQLEGAKEKQAFTINVSCPRCNHSLMDPAFEIDGHPSIRVRMSFDHQHGWLRLSSLYGNGSYSAECDVPRNTIAGLFCPHCHAQLAAGPDCAQCEAPMVPMIVRGGGIVQFCSRRGCKNHMLDLA